MLKGKIFGVEAWRYALGLFGAGAIALGISGGGLSHSKPIEQQKSQVSVVESPRKPSVIPLGLRLYEVLDPSSLSEKDLGSVMGTYQEYGTVVNYSKGGRIEGTIVEWRDVNSDRVWDITTYLTEDREGHYPALGLNSRSSQYKGLLEKFGDKITARKDGRISLGISRGR